MVAPTAPESPTGMEFLYSAESIRLAVAWADVLRGDPCWCSVNPATHISEVRDLDREGVADRLVDKYARLPAAADQDTFLALATFCGIIPEHEDFDRLNALQAGVAEVFRWTSMDSDPRGTGPLRLWFVVESVALASYGGYANPARNMTQPEAHRDWSRDAPIRGLIRDLSDKTREQLLRIYDDGERQAVAYTAETFSRCVAWGGQVPVGCPPSGRAADWQATCRSWFQNDPGNLRQRLDLMLRGTAWNLLISGRSGSNGREAISGQL